MPTTDALDQIEQLFHVSTTYTGGTETAPPTACTVVFSLRGMPAHHTGEKPTLIDCTHDPTAQIAIADNSACTLQHWQTLPDNFAAYASQETFTQAALQAAAQNLPPPLNFRSSGML